MRGMLFQGGGSKYPLMSIWAARLPVSLLSPFLDLRSARLNMLCRELNTCLFMSAGRHFLTFVFEKLERDFPRIGGSSDPGTGLN